MREYDKLVEFVLKMKKVYFFVKDLPLNEVMEFIRLVENINVHSKSMSNYECMIVNYLVGYNIINYSYFFKMRVIQQCYKESNLDKERSHGVIMDLWNKVSEEVNAIHQLHSQKHDIENELMKQTVDLFNLLSVKDDDFVWDKETVNKTIQLTNIKFNLFKDLVTNNFINLTNDEMVYYIEICKYCCSYHDDMELMISKYLETTKYVFYYKDNISRNFKLSFIYWYISYSFLKLNDVDINIKRLEELRGFGIKLSNEY